MQSFTGNQDIFKKYINNPFDLLTDPEFEFERVFNPEGSFNVLYKIANAKFLDLDYRGKFRQIESQHHTKPLDFYFLSRFSFRYSNFKLIWGRGFLNAIFSICVNCQLQNLDEISIKRALAPTARKVLTDETKVLYHYSEAKPIMKELIFRAPIRGEDCYANLQNLFNELDPENKVCDRMRNYMSDLFKG